MNNPPIKLKRDKYKSSRGGHSRLLDICCRQCGTSVLVYQKDGPGTLLRLYLDRILSPATLTGRQYSFIETVPVLKCPKCAALLATAYIYEKERRPAYRLIHDSIIKKLK